uniref:Ketol-acid reductoisomerase n=1 Tax=Candidatus Kentrum eta TaxID=2126337 RepID=A0A450V6G6_9GAMM|nr:MAG: ketol-acid reductoisomerase [Candidatus Kentron sp. H]VFK00426.1 MAG: ketol-acid reductoisomerase [Candidatus Kentron sp. H]VFK04555.1 MAG: ketol-acid reductoisomerase [Candidatus Kentron sp. H]
MAKIDFGGVVEEIITREEFPRTKAREVLKDETIAVLGYGVQGPAQALNMKENGFRVIVGQEKRFRKDWDRAISDGWVPGDTLFDMVEAAERGTIIQMLVSDAAQKAIWPRIKPELDEGDALYFSHGFSIVYKDQTCVVPPNDCDVLLVAPKGSGLNVRRNFLSGAGINSSFSVFQDYTGRARERAIALGIGIGSAYLFPTTFENEVYSDLTGERGVLMGALAGIMEAQYQVLRENGHSPSEAFNETVEELTQSLIRLVDENGMDWMYANCSATAQRGALDWLPKFKAATLPVFKELYQRVRDGIETHRVIETCGGENYQETLTTELAELGKSEMWRTGKTTRALRPKEPAKVITEGTRGVGGRTTN